MKFKVNLILLTLTVFALVSLCSCSGCDHDLTIHRKQRATCTEIGWDEYEECKKCDYTTYVEIPATGHKEKVIKGRDATCTSTGISDGKICTICDEVLVEREVTAKTSHTYVDYDAVEPTCLLPGCREFRRCSGCGIGNYCEIPALRSHNYKNGACTRCNEEAPSEGLLYFSNGDGTCSVSSEDPITSSSIVIPSLSPDGDYVTEIEHLRFEYEYTLTSITLPSTLLEVANGVFYNHVRLIEVVNNSSLDITAGSRGFGDIAMFAKHVHSGKSEIEHRDGFAFLKINGQNYLVGYDGDEREIALPESFDGASYKISDHAFYGSLVARINIPDGISEITGEAFYGCSRLRSITLGAGLTYIDTNAFKHCGALIEIINHSPLYITAGSKDNGHIAEYAAVVHDGESVIITRGEYLFYSSNGENYLIGYLGNRRYITLPDNYNGEGYKIYKGAFSNNKSITEVVIPDGATEIGRSAFSWCLNLESVVIKDGVRIIEESAFFYCENLRTVVLGNNVTEIRESAFGHCYLLSRVTIPKSVIFIGSYAFDSSIGTLIFEDPEGWWAFNRETDQTGTEIPPEHLTNHNYEAISKYQYYRYYLRKLGSST